MTTPHRHIPAIPASMPIALGPRTRAQAARLLEQALGALWAAVLESHGHDVEDGWSVEVVELRLVRAQPGAAPVGAEPGPPEAERRAGKNGTNGPPP